MAKLMDNDLTVLIVQTDRRRSNNRCIDLCAESARVRIAHFDTACICPTMRNGFTPSSGASARAFCVRLFTSSLSPFAAQLRFVLCERTSDQFAAAMPYHLRFVSNGALNVSRAVSHFADATNHSQFDLHAMAAESVCMGVWNMCRWLCAVGARLIRMDIVPRTATAAFINLQLCFFQTHNSQLPILSLSRPSRHCRYALQPIFNHLQAYILICIYPRTCPWRIISRSWSDKNES